MSPARELALWAEKLAQATARRNEAIVAMRGHGAAHRAIAEAAGLSHTAVAKILAKAGVA